MLLEIYLLSILDYIAITARVVAWTFTGATFLMAANAARQPDSEALAATAFLLKLFLASLLVLSLSALIPTSDSLKEAAETVEVLSK